MSMYEDDMIDGEIHRALEIINQHESKKRCKGASMTHTKEPWEVLGSNFPQIVDAKGCVAMMAPDAPMPIQIANAKRIVACVNACAGITTEALEKGAVKEAKDLGILRDGLLPCPFCGEYPKLMHDPHMKNYWFFCEGCEIETMYYDTKQQAIDAWNRRD